MAPPAEPRDGDDDATRLLVVEITRLIELLVCLMIFGTTYLTFAESFY